MIFQDTNNDCLGSIRYKVHLIQFYLTVKHTADVSKDSSYLSIMALAPALKHSIVSDKGRCISVAATAKCF